MCGGSGIRNLDISPGTPAERTSELIFAVDLGGTYLRAATVDEDGRIHFRFKQKTPHGPEPDEIVRALVDVVRQCEAQSKSSGESIRAVSVVVPGSVNVEQGLVMKAPNLSCLDGFRLTAALTSELKLPAVVENDANAAAVGEMWQGAGHGRRTIVCVTLGTGVGGGIILDGKLWRGVNDSAAEIGHMCVDPFGGVACLCGSRGCLEVYASATAIVRMARDVSPRYPHSLLRGREDLTAEDLYRAGLKGDKLALEVFRGMGVYLGIGLANLINILNPEMIVIGGGVVNAWELFERHMHREISERAFPVPAKEAKVVPAQRGDDAGLLGAAYMGFNLNLQSIQL